MEPQKRKKIIYILLISIIMLAFLLRGAFFIKNLHNFNISGDARNYHLMSRQLVDKGIFGYWYEGNPHGGKAGVSNARVTPGYPFFLGGIYYIFHDQYLSITVARLMQVIIGALTPLLAFMFVRRLFKRNLAGLIAAFFTAVYPSYILSPIYLLTEVLALATMLAYFYLTLIGLQKKKAYLNILAGAMFAVHILIRPAMLPLFVVPYIYAFIIWDKEHKNQVFKYFFQAAGAFVVLMIPWWVRNYLVLGSFILTANASGNPLLGGTYPYMKDLMKDVPEKIKGLSNPQADFAKERIIKGFTTEPLLYFKWYTIGKTEYMFDKPWLYYALPQIRLFNLLILQAASMTIHYFLLIVGVAGVIINSIFSKVSRFVNIYAIIFLGLYLIFIPDNRYAYQHMFFLIMAAAYLACLLYDFLRKKLVVKVTG